MAFERQKSNFMKALKITDFYESNTLNKTFNYNEQYNCVCYLAAATQIQYFLN